MVNVCCVEGCVQTKDVAYFNVPNSRTLLKKWLEAFTPNCKVTNQSVVCSKHFLEEQYVTFRGKARLKPKVIPSIFDSKISVPKSTNKKKPNSNKTPTIEIEKDKKEKLLKNKIKVKVLRKKGVDKRKNESIVERTEPIIATTESEANTDIEEIIKNYHIKQIRPINRDLETDKSINLETDKSINLESNNEIEDLITNFYIKQTRPINSDLVQESGQNGSKEENDMNNVIDVDNLKDPVFIEVSVNKGGEKSHNQDCLMLLESVQCDVDPTSLMLEDPDPDLDDDVVDLGEKKEDPISLLTSSDEDDVIIQEPKIDTVEVSDETDEDDVPLVKLIEKPPLNNEPKLTRKRTRSEDLLQMMWGIYNYFCEQCPYKTESMLEYKRHSAEHPTVVRVCQICGYTTASKSQLHRHKRKHKKKRN